MRTAVIIPAFNEADALPGVLAELVRHNPDHDLVVVDDGSTDDTAVVARAAGATCLRLPFNLGIGSALRLGFRYVVEHDYDRAYQFDADGQHDASQVEPLLAGLTDADMVIGSRFIGERGYRVGRSRGIAMALLRRLVTWICGQNFTDTSSGFRAFRRPVLELFATEYPAEYMESVEALVLAVRRGFTVGEVPVMMHNRAGGRASNRNLRLAYHFVRLLIVLVAGGTDRGRVPRRAP
ncbi:MAG: glycosyltransferase family 2 protein [Actinomycetota bacterium]|nr:glycosyltransferase family 2 protein [Actinomycetota bacterium]